MLYNHTINKYMYIFFADLANILQDEDGASEVAHVEDGQFEVDVTIVTDALGKRFPARVT